MVGKRSNPERNLSEPEQRLDRANAPVQVPAADGVRRTGVAGIDLGPRARVRLLGAGLPVPSEAMAKVNPPAAPQD